MLRLGNDLDEIGPFEIGDAEWDFSNRFPDSAESVRGYADRLGPSAMFVVAASRSSRNASATLDYTPNIKHVLLQLPRQRADAGELWASHAERARDVPFTTCRAMLCTARESSFLARRSISVRQASSAPSSTSTSRRSNQRANHIGAMLLRQRQCLAEDFVSRRRHAESLLPLLCRTPNEAIRAL
jgi:hypothetical protein